MVVRVGLDLRSLMYWGEGKGVSKVGARAYHCGRCCDQRLMPTTAAVVD